MRTLLEEIEDMVRQEGPTQIINLFIEDQTDNIMFEELSNLMIWGIGCDVLQKRKKEGTTYS